MPTEVPCVEAGCGELAGIVEGPGRKPVRCPAHNALHRREYLRIAKRRQRFNQMHPQLEEPAPRGAAWERYGDCRYCGAAAGQPCQRGRPPFGDQEHAHPQRGKLRARGRGRTRPHTGGEPLQAPADRP